MGAPVREPSAQAAGPRRRDWSYWLLMAGIAILSFGVAWLIDWRRPVIAIVLVVVGAVLVGTMRIRRTRAGLRP